MLALADAHPGRLTDEVDVILVQLADLTLTLRKALKFIAAELLHLLLEQQFLLILQAVRRLWLAVQIVQQQRIARVERAELWRRKDGLRRTAQRVQLVVHYADALHAEVPGERRERKLIANDFGRLSRCIGGGKVSEHHSRVCPAYTIGKSCFDGTRAEEHQTIVFRQKPQTQKWYIVCVDPETSKQKLSSETLLCVGKPVGYQVAGAIRLNN